MRKVTLKMIAQEVGVSIGTVDRALNNRGRILPETKARILSVAQRLGYQPNRLASSLRRNLHFKIAVVMAKEPEYFTSELLYGFEQARQELSGYDLELQFLYSDSLASQDQVPVLQALDPTHYDAITINAGSEALAPYMNQISATGVPVVTFNSDIAGSRRLFYVGEDPYKSGRIAGELMGKMLRRKGTVAIFAGFSIVNSHRDRAAGFRDYLKEHCPEVSILNVLEYHDREDEAYTAMEKAVKYHGRIDGVFCVSAAGAIGVGKYCQEHFAPGQICLIGYDVNHRSAQLLQEDYCAALIYQEPRKQSHHLLHLLFQMLSGGQPPAQDAYYTKTRIIVSQNLDDTPCPVLEQL